MAYPLISSGCFVLKVRYLIRRPNGSFYYYRRVPEDMRGHHSGLTFIRKSLRTRDPSRAARAAAKLAHEHDALWRGLRTPQAKALKLTTEETRASARVLLETLELELGSRRNADGTVRDDFDPGDILESHFERRYGEDWLEARHDPQSLIDPDSLLSPVDVEMFRQLDEPKDKPQVYLSDALTLYFAEHRNGSKPKFVQGTKVAIQAVYDSVADLPLGSYTRENARAVRDALAQGRSTGTVRRRLRTIVAVFNKGLIEFGLGGIVENPFARLSIVNEGDDEAQRPPFNNVELKTIAQACKRRNDDIRWLVAMQFDTGARLAEIVGLRVEDVSLGGDTPFVWIREHKKLGRTLKTRGSVRKVPLVGMSLWGAQEAAKAASGTGVAKTGWLFPRYSSDDFIKSTYSSGTVNKWLRDTLGIPKTSHSFRHSMRDRLRAVSTPVDIRDAIGGWSTSRSVGEGYGKGHSLAALKVYLDKVILDD